MNIYDFFKESVPYIAVVNKLVLGIFNNFVNFLNGTIYVCASAPNENEISRFSPSLRTDLDREMRGRAQDSRVTRPKIAIAERRSR